MQFDDRIIEGIAGSGLGGTVMIPNLLRKSRKLFAAAGFETPGELQQLDSALEKVRVLVHHGGMGTAMAGIAKGVPQLIIYSDLDKYHRGKAISEAGAGLMLNRKTVTKQQVSEAIRTLERETSYLQSAKHLSEANADLLKTSAISALADLAESIIQPGTH
jgi:UDP:flavonoid glycosyltransferase YjiC (YdhE family)